MEIKQSGQPYEKLLMKKVRVLIRKSSNTLGIDGLDIEKYYGDLTDYESVLEAVDGCKYIYHVAADTSMRGSRKQSFAVNVDGSVNIARAAMKTGIKKMVYVSSASIVGWGTMDNPATENTEFNIDFMIGNCYIDSKMEAEKQILELCKKGLPAVLTYPTLMYGRWDVQPSSGILLKFIKYFPWFYTPGGGNIIHAEDAAIGHILAMEKGRIGEKYIIGDKNLYAKDIVTITNKILGRKPPRFRVPPFLLIAMCTFVDVLSKIIRVNLKLSAHMAKFGFITHFLSPEKARKELGIPQSPTETAIRDEITFLQETKYL